MTDQGRFASDLSSARLAVVNTNSTSILEALALNFPTVAIINYHHWPLRSKVKGTYHELEAAGILYRDSESAAQHVSDIYDDVMTWWRDATVQKARVNFVERFAHRDRELFSNFEGRVLKKINEYEVRH